jgi:hypothetical protein
MVLKKASNAQKNERATRTKERDEYYATAPILISAYPPLVSSSRSLFVEDGFLSPGKYFDQLGANNLAGTAC